MGRNAKPWYREATDSWYATIAGKQQRLAKGEKNRHEATQEFHRLKAEEGEAVKERAALPVYLLADMFYGSIKKSHEPGPLAWYKRNILSFVKHVGRDALSAQIKPSDVTNWLEATTWVNNTKSSASNIVKRMFNWGVEEGYLESSPVAKLKGYATSPREEILTQSQADTIYQAAESEVFRDLLTALRETGCRPAEIYTLTVDRVDLVAGTWQVIDKIRKKTGRKYRTVYLSAEMIELSRRLVGQHGEGVVFRNHEGNPWRKPTVGDRFRRMRKKLEYGPECVPYSYRHIFVTDALERGVSPATVAELVGHLDLKMIMSVYSKLRHRTDHLREAVAAARKAPEVSRPAERSGDDPREHG